MVVDKQTSQGKKPPSDKGLFSLIQEVLFCSKRILLKSRITVDCLLFGFIIVMNFFARDTLKFAEISISGRERKR
jgi:hypothetical protein